MSEAGTEVAAQAADQTPLTGRAEDKVGGANKPSLIIKFARKYNIVESTLMTTLKDTCFKQGEGSVSNEQMVALLVVADQYNLNPFTKEIYAYPDKYKGIVPVVSIDGWVRIVTEHPDYNGYDVILPAEMIKANKEGEHPPCWPWITIQMHRKRVEHTPQLTEYFDECYKPPYKPRGKDYFIDSPWQTHPKRFLRHKAFIQAGRLVFGFAGIYDDDEAHRILESSVVATVAAGGGGATRTESVKDKLRQTLEDKRGTAETITQELRQAEREVASRPDREQRTWNESQRSVAAEPAKPTFKYDVASALALLRAQTTVGDIKAAYKKVVDDYDFSERELPIDVEAIYRDLKEALEQREASKSRDTEWPTK
jgi:phage recombination protein Bet